MDQQVKLQAVTILLTIVIPQLTVHEVVVMCVCVCVQGPQFEGIRLIVTISLKLIAGQYYYKTLHSKNNPKSR